MKTHTQLTLTLLADSLMYSVNGVENVGRCLSAIPSGSPNRVQQLSLSGHVFYRMFFTRCSFYGIPCGSLKIEDTVSIGEVILYFTQAGRKAEWKGEELRVEILGR